MNVRAMSEFGAMPPDEPEEGMPIGWAVVYDDGGTPDVFAGDYEEEARKRAFRSADGSYGAPRPCSVERIDNAERRDALLEAARLRDASESGTLGTEFEPGDLPPT